MKPWKAGGEREFAALQIPFPQKSGKISAWYERWIHLMQEYPQSENPGVLETGKKVLNKILNYAMGIALYAMVTFVFINAVLRYVFNSGWPASEELGRFLFVWVSMLGALIAYRENKHVGVDLVVSKLKGKTRMTVDIIGLLVILIILSVVLYGGWGYFLTVSHTPAPATNLPMGIMAMALLVCVAGMMLIALTRILGDLKEITRKGAAE
ncbi:TRAP transporter small permease [Anaerotruncus sp. AF02-27]|nr:TRAP transporter small permease [Anaerotruncus sp. AF02-27]